MKALIDLRAFSGQVKCSKMKVRRKWSQTQKTVKKLSCKRFKEATKRKLFDHFCDTETRFQHLIRKQQFTICIIKQLGGVVCTLNQIYSHSRSGNASFWICNNKRLKCDSSKPLKLFNIIQNYFNFFEIIHRNEIKKLTKNI